MNSITTKRDVIVLFSVKDGNPNGDPDAANAPRTDLQGYGLTTDVFVKRRVRNYLMKAAAAGEADVQIHVVDGAALDAAPIAMASEIDEEVGAGIEATAKAKGAKDGKAKKAKRAGDDLKAAVAAKMCERYFDVRAFGSVFAISGANMAVRGPVQCGFARSITPIEVQRHAITRCASDTEREGKDNKTMGSKWTTNGVYRVHLTVDVSDARKTGYSEADHVLLLRALREMFEVDRSSSKGLMTTLKVIDVSHARALGDCSSAAVAAAIGDDGKIGMEKLPASVKVTVFDGMKWGEGEVVRRVAA